MRKTAWTEGEKQKTKTNTTTTMMKALCLWISTGSAPEVSGFLGKVIFLVGCIYRERQRGVPSFLLLLLLFLIASFCAIVVVGVVVAGGGGREENVCLFFGLFVSPFVFFSLSFLSVFTFFSAAAAAAAAAADK